MRAVLGCVAVLALAVGGSAAGQDKKDPIDGKKLIGKWSPEKIPQGTKVVIEFADKGKMLVTIDVMGKSDKLEGKYELKDNKLTLTLKKMDKEEKEEMTILKLTDELLEMKDSKGSAETLKRIK